MEMLRRLFGRSKPAETGETAKSDGEITDWHRGYGFLNIVDANPLDYVDPFPFMRLREDLRRNVLEFVIGASWNGVRTLPEPWTFPDERPEHLRFAFSAAASMRTLTFHARSIKAVCTAVATDVRLLEKTVASRPRGSRGSGTLTAMIGGRGRSCYRSAWIGPWPRVVGTSQQIFTAASMRIAVVPATTSTSRALRPGQKSGSSAPNISSITVWVGNLTQEIGSSRGRTLAVGPRSRPARGT